MFANLLHFAQRYRIVGLGSTFLQGEHAYIRIYRRQLTQGHIDFRKMQRFFVNVTLAGRTAKKTRWSQICLRILCQIGVQNREKS